MPPAAGPGKQQTLLKLGPFKALNASAAEEDLSAEYAVAASNCTTKKKTGGLTLSKGRTLLNFTSNVGLSPVSGLAPFDVNLSADVQRFIAISRAVASPNAVSLYSPDVGSLIPVENALPFGTAVQFGDRLFTDQGQQIINGGGFAYAWQQLPVIRTYTIVNNDSAATASGTFLVSGTPTTTHNNVYVIGGVTFTCPQTTGNTPAAQATADAAIINAGFPASALASTITVMALERGAAGNTTTTTASSTGGDTVVANQATMSGGSNGPLTGDEVLSYAFTRVTTFPDGTQQESTPDGALVVGSPLAYPYSYLVQGDGDGTTITPSSPWSGTNADGSTFFTYAYRWSSLQPIFYWLAKLTGSSPYTDNASDASLLPNAQLTLNQDPPPFNTGYPIGIFSHKNCMMVMAAQLTQDLDELQGVNYSLWQSQLWFSDYGTPYAFNSVDQVLLVGQEGMPSNPFPGAFGDLPLGGLSFSSLAALLKTRSTWVLYGDDASTFLVRKVADIGCQSLASAAACEGIGIWLTERGVYSFNGGVMQYIGEPVREIINGITQADRHASVGWYGDHIYYLSFPATGITLRYYTPSQEWLPSLPYAAVAGYAVPSEPQPATIPAIPVPLPGSLIAFDYMVAADPLGNIDLWNSSPTDRGAAITGTWQGPQSDSGAPWAQKVYRYVTVVSPVGAVGICKVTVTADAQVIFTGTFDLSQGPAVTQAIPGDGPGPGNRGFVCSVSLALTGANAEVDAVVISGTMDREFVIPDSYAGA